MEAGLESNSSVHVTSDATLRSQLRSAPRHCSAPVTLRMGSHLQRDPFELSNLLPAGVLALTLFSLDQDLPRVVSQAEWSAFDKETANGLHTHCSPEDATLLKNLSFLVVHDFARVTSKFSSPHSLLLRVYLTPYDLPGVQGRLMNRQEHILVGYRRSLKKILPRLSSGGDYWKDADLLLPNPSVFLPASLVSVSVDPSKFTPVLKLTTGREDHGGDIQRITLPRARRTNGPSSGNSRRFTYLRPPLHPPSISTYIRGCNVAEGIAFTIHSRSYIHSSQWGRCERESVLPPAGHARTPTRLPQNLYCTGRYSV